MSEKLDLELIVKIGMRMTKKKLSLDYFIFGLTQLYFFF